MDGFDEFWATYPHHGTRSVKVMAKAKWQEITGKGLNAKIRDREGNTMNVTLTATPEEIITGTKAYRMSLDDPQYACGAQVFLNQGRWMDFDNAEELAARYDKLQAHKQELERRGVQLRAVS